ncbi:MAG: bacterioferritin-associated ferredoxin [Phycisphaerales bacterium]
MPVDRCICQSITFAALRELARSRSLDLDGLKRETGCAMRCTLCEPYLKLMLRTGRTQFEPGEAAGVTRLSLSVKRPESGATG